jgi:hypothetical protein
MRPAVRRREFTDNLYASSRRRLHIDTGVCRCRRRRRRRRITVGLAVASPLCLARQCG